MRLTIFYGYPAWLVAQWCGVSKRTAERWKTGQISPTPCHVALFKLHAEQRLLPAGWRYDERSRQLFSPEGEHFPLELLRAWAAICQLARERAGDEAVDQLWRAAGY